MSISRKREAGLTRVLITGNCDHRNDRWVRTEARRRHVSHSQIIDEALAAARDGKVYQPPMPGVIGQSLDAAANRADSGADPANR